MLTRPSGNRSSAAWLHPVSSNMKVEPEEFDLVVYGTGLPESIIAA